MTRPIDDEYLEWLYRQVDQIKERSPVLTHWGILRELYKTEFVWFVPNDDNRATDGCDLRIEFMRDRMQFVSMDWVNQPCSMLEMLIALARRCQFEAGGKVDNWFWHLMNNVDLRISDRQYETLHKGIVKEILDDIIWRRYLPNGKGGLFPLKNPEHDQREVEIWYQMSAYLVEMGI